MTLLTLTPGTLFAGRYRITRCIAQGGMGAVYEVIHLETERRRALKVMLPDMLQSQEMRDRFRQEARVTANIESEFLVDVFDAGIDDATKMPFLVMEFLRGEEVHKKLKRVGRFPFADVITYLHQAALALDKTHKASIVHRDLKPGNLFLTERDDGSPRVKVLDFGIAKLVAEGATNAEATRNLGTPVYMAPEQFYIGGKISPASDIFALGMIAFTLLVGTPYWHEEMTSGANVFAFAASAVLGPQEAACPRALRRGVKLPPAFDAWFAKITANEPADRFPTATSAILALSEVLGVPFGPAAHRIAPPETTATGPISVPTSAPRSDAVGVWPVDSRNQPSSASGRPAAAPPVVPTPTPPVMMASPPPISQAPPPLPATRQSQVSLPFLATGLATPPPGSNPDIGRASAPPPAPQGIGLSTPTSNPSLMAAAAAGAYPLMQSSAPTTATGVMTGMPEAATAKRPTPVVLASVIGGSIIAVLLVVLLMIDSGAPKSASGAPKSAEATSAAANAKPALSAAAAVAAAVVAARPSVPDPSPLIDLDSPSSSAGAAVAASASPASKKPAKPGGGAGPKRPTIYTPD